MSELKDKRVLVTGGSGFIASHLTRRLVSIGAEVGILTKYNSVIDNIRLVDVWDRLAVIEADLRNVDSLRQVREFHPDILFHLAAYNHVGDSFTHVSEAIDSNVKGTANLFDAYDDFERFVYTATSEVYGYQRQVPFEEGMCPAPLSPYAIGKYGGELLCHMKMHRGDERIVVLRPFNAFGPYQSPRAVIAEVILTCLAGRAVYATEGKQTRDFNFVDNLVNGFVLAAESDEALGLVINLGSGREISIHDLIVQIHDRTGSSSELHIGALANRPNEIWRMVADNTCARSVLGWEPVIGLEEGLDRTIEWFREYRDHFLNPDSQLQRLSTFPNR